jgi:hypothetical protein
LLPIPGKTLLPITLASREVKFGFWREANARLN